MTGRGSSTTAAASTAESGSQHHVEAFCESKGHRNLWGWQCLTCGAEGYVRTAVAANAAVDAHAEATSSRGPRPGCTGLAVIDSKECRRG